MYRTYKDDDINQPSDFGFVTNLDEGYENSDLDIRNLANPNAHDINTPEGMVALFRESIDAGTLE